MADKTSSFCKCKTKLQKSINSNVKKVANTEKKVWNPYCKCSVCCQGLKCQSSPDKSSKCKKNHVCKNMKI